MPNSINAANLSCNPTNSKIVYNFVPYDNPQFSEESQEQIEDFLDIVEEFLRTHRPEIFK